MYYTHGNELRRNTGSQHDSAFHICVLANMTLGGLEKVVLQSVPYRSRVNFVRYADDFIITAKSITILEKYVLPAVKRFLGERGLELSEEKTRITHIRNGFTFLGQTFRKHGNTLHIIPLKEGVLALIQKLGMIIRKYVKAPLVIMANKLNEMLRGLATEGSACGKTILSGSEEAMGQQCP